MFDAFVIALREGSELILILLAMRELLLRAGRRELSVWLGRGVAFGAVLCGLGLAMSANLGIGVLLEAALMLVFGISLAIMSLGTLASEASIRRHAVGFLDHQLGRAHAGLFIAGFAAFSATREIVELALFARAFAPRFPASDIALGMAGGLLACGLLVLVWMRLRARAGMLWAFRLSALYLLFTSVQMAIHGATLLLLSGLLPFDQAQLQTAIEPYVHGGERHWLLCALLLAAPVAWSIKSWWRRSAGSV